MVMVPGIKRNFGLAKDWKLRSHWKQSFYDRILEICLSKKDFENTNIEFKLLIAHTHVSARVCVQ
jgi:hypothetical protein